MRPAFSGVQFPESVVLFEEGEEIGREVAMRACSRGPDVRWACFLAAAVFGNAPRAYAGTNLLNNPGAEAGPSGSVIPGWNTTGTLEVVPYDAGGGFPTLGDPGSPTRASKFFSGGPSSQESSAYHGIILSQFESAIDAGTQSCTLSGWIGGYSVQNDHCDVFATLYDSEGAALGQVSIGGVLAAERGAHTGMFFRSSTVPVPIGTRQAVVQVRMTRTEGTYNDGYADDLSFSLGAACPCDLNGDGLVEDADFTLFVGSYSILDCVDPTMTPGCPADFSGDGLVDDADFTIFVVAYNALVCP